MRDVGVWQIKADLHDLSDKSSTRLVHASIRGDRKTAGYGGDQLEQAVVTALDKAAPDVEVDVAWYGD